MKKTLLAMASAVVALAFASCAYDPYYYGPSHAAGPSGYYGESYDGGSVSTSVFISTGDPRWGYDPTCYSYYDYNRRAYYDPYLNGYYPVGYHPVIVLGVPHPYGWSSGHGHIRPPSHVSNTTISNYHNREGLYRSSHYSWANQVQQRPSNDSRQQQKRPSTTSYNSQNAPSRPSSGYRPSTNPYAGSTPSTRPSWGTHPSQTGSAPPKINANRPAQFNNQATQQGRLQPSRSPYGLGAQSTTSRQQAPALSNRQPAPQRGDGKKKQEPQAQ